MTINELFGLSINKKPFPKEEICLEKVEISYRGLRKYLSENPTGLLYGVDTGFGPHALQGNDDRILIQKILINHLTVVPVEDKPASYFIPNKSNTTLSREETRSVLAARILVLSQGYSGVKKELLDKLIQLLETDDLPSIPLRGSLGASGDLIPLSSIAHHLDKKGWSWEEKEAIAITNGTSFMTGLLSFQTVYLEKLLHILEDLLRVQFSLMEIFPDAFHSVMAECRKSESIKHFLERVRPFIKARIKKKGERIQDSYLIRAIPMIWGTTWERLDSIKNELNKEIYTVSDNPVYSFEEERFVEGGLFFGSTISMLSDDLNLTVLSIANWLERMIQFNLDPKENENRFPLMLSSLPGFYAGLAGLGLYSTHLIAEMRRDSHPGSLQSLPGNGGNQNIVPMGSLSVIRNRRTLDDLQSLVVVYLVTLLQMKSFYLDSVKHSHNKKTGNQIISDTTGNETLQNGESTSFFDEAWELWKPLEKDRPLDKEIRDFHSLLEKYLKKDFL